MILSPGTAKLIVENLPGTIPILATRGERIGRHVKKAFRYRFDGPTMRQISIVSTSTEAGVTVYVNKLSTIGRAFPEADLKPTRLAKTYKKGSEGDTGDLGLSAAAGGLETLNPAENDVLRLSVPTEEAFNALLVWYFNAFVADSSESTLNLTTKSIAIRDDAMKPEVALPVTTDTDKQAVSSISSDDQTKLALDTPGLRTGEREAVVNVRFGQGSFREALLKLDGERCWMSGIEGKRLLVASHIKPWSHCDADIDSRGQPDNGLLLSPLWDSVFDSGHIGFNSEFKVVASTNLSESALRALKLSECGALPVKFRTARRAKYLEYHLNEVFDHWKNDDSV